MRKFRRQQKQDNDRGSEVMGYLGEEAARSISKHPNGVKHERGKTDVQEMDLPSLKERISFKPSRSSNIVQAPASQEGPPLRLFNKYASDKKGLLHTPISELISKYKKATVSPLVDSALKGLALTGITYGLDKFFNPDDDAVINQETAEYLKENKIQPSTVEEVKAYKEFIKSRRRRNRWLLSGAVGLGGAVFNSYYNYVPGRPETIYKWASGVPKKASMLGNLTAMDLDQVKAAVLSSPMTDGDKYLSMSMLNTINKPMVTSTDIVGAAVNTGVSAFGSPIGRYTVAAAADAATGYGIGKLLGISAPGRLAAAAGIGSFLARTLQPINNSDLL